MKTASAVRAEKIKDGHSDVPVTHSSVSFQPRKADEPDDEKFSVSGFFQELKTLIDSGDDSAWRLWR